jgi:hypothetical protein
LRRFIILELSESPKVVRIIAFENFSFDNPFPTAGENKVFALAVTLPLSKGKGWGWGLNTAG